MAEDWREAAEELEGDLAGKADSSEVEELRSDLRLAGEAIGLLRGIIDDLLDVVETDREEYADDLQRLDQLAHLLLLNGSAVGADVVAVTTGVG